MDGYAKRTELARRQTKSSEGEFIWELQHSYELSPKLSEQILLTGKRKLNYFFLAQEV
jgi:hypothetical protein